MALNVIQSSVRVSSATSLTFSSAIKSFVTPSLPLATHRFSLSPSPNLNLLRIPSSPPSFSSLRRGFRGGRITAMASSAPGSVNKPEEEWRAVLSPEQFRILRQKGTESVCYEPYSLSCLDLLCISPAWFFYDNRTGEYNKVFGEGIYSCAGCGTPLYKSATKFDSGCGWPAFFDGIPGAINRTADPDGRRIEITCAACGGHLGHVFKGEGFPTPTDERHCVNSVSLKFAPGNATL
ncbi:hypothetical protein YC2023_087153 [Brassica napus]